ncbi:type IX secretion system membrane protein PorP/SprF [Polaribacter vadi]|uniref:PorP/SprF family type IX secretion system membrane protein n=1 Tax=Polaribacter TaxID=52959 RepID=UPI001C08BB18|nr:MULTISPECIES: type IX secretion system membrane protein PorP/SprF [Polaribacter]MBU3010677.1 type IX secretion system membrane protein PorP/SprF [Polaribacter vadi]MDO6740488.1 type IX secretion system membrane protein PorP/SprF [Polaribacter sp. 1_MG-2023]
MKLLNNVFPFLFLFLLSLKSNSQETLPIYQDYLSDNVYLVHPSAAGIGNSSKLRFTARQQWAGIPNAPALQTMSFHSKFNEYSNAGYGFVLFNDKNGFHSQKGIQGAYSYHLPMSNGKVFNQLSFGLAFSFVQNQSDQTSFTGDPTISRVVESTSYYNADFGVAYHLGGFSSYFTVKNLLLTAKNNLNIQEPLDLRNYILSAGYYFGENLFVHFEPSVMLQFRESTGERIADFNLKAYKTFSKTQFWAALSYRRSFDVNAIENAQFISPIVGVNYQNLMFSYTYTNQMNDTVLTTSGFHQISLGINLWTQEPRAAACPNINSAFGGF